MWTYEGSISPNDPVRALFKTIRSSLSFADVHKKRGYKLLVPRRTRTGNTMLRIREDDTRSIGTMAHQERVVLGRGDQQNIIFVEPIKKDTERPSESQERMKNEEAAGLRTSEKVQR